jgi:hypothetical protein
MLRITVHDNPGSLTVQLEGWLAGPWVRELEDCWQRTQARPRKPVLRFDLTGVTSIDAAVKSFLAAMHTGGGVPRPRLPDQSCGGRDYSRPGPRPRASGEQGRGLDLTELRYNMETNQTGHSRQMPLGSLSAFWVAALLIAGLIGGLWFVLAADSAWKAVPFVAVLGLTAVAGITWQQSRASARRRLQAALAAYAEREIRQQRRSSARLPKSAD